jgi:hypothetical protein
MANKFFSPLLGATPERVQLAVQRAFDLVKDSIAHVLTSPLTTKGDLWTFGTKDARLAVGTADGQVLTVDSTAATGQSWQTPANGIDKLMLTVDGDVVYTGDGIPTVHA